MKKLLDRLIVYAGIAGIVFLVSIVWVGILFVEGVNRILGRWSKPCAS